YPVGTLRGVDVGAWYTVAWFNKYLKHDPTADARLLTGRWRNDAKGAAHDPSRDPNLLSEFYRSRIAVHTPAGRATGCENLRAGCASLTAADDDCGRASYGYLPVATHPDDGTDPGRAPCSSDPHPTPTPALTGSRSARTLSRTRRVRVRVRGATGLRQVRLTLTDVAHRVVAEARRRSIPSDGRITLRVLRTGTVKPGRYRLHFSAVAALTGLIAVTKDVRLGR
ncbi:MAG: hypothetical protein JWM31_180, partial [Solirubrobacterales bacterium]|nr:hypothetical protein [Solirubrobacterales bacterium]